MQQSSPASPSDGDMGSLDRLDSLDDYFMISSPPESPQQPHRPITAAAAAAPSVPFDIYGYYAGSGANSIAVHQDNVKRSTSNISVDRSNAVGRYERTNSIGGIMASFGAGASRMLPSTQKDMDELLKLVEDDNKDFNLSEMFLQSNHRTSLNENYQAMGKLKGYDKELHRTRSHSLSSSFLSDNQNTTTTNDDGNNNNNNDNNDKTGATTNNNKTTIDNNNNNNNDSANAEMDLNLDDVLPTPLSEIRAKSEYRQLRREQQQQPSTTTTDTNNNDTTTSSRSDGLTSQKLDQHQYEHRKHRIQHSSNYYPFGRSYQLPIPTMPPMSPPNNKSNDNNNNKGGGEPALSDAVATAAALASVQETETDGATNTNNATSNIPTAANQPQKQPPHHTPPHSPAVQSANPASSSWQQKHRTSSTSPSSQHSATSSHHSSHHHSQQPQYPHHPPPIPPHASHPANHGHPVPPPPSQQHHHHHHHHHHPAAAGADPHHPSYPPPPHHLAPPLPMGTLPYPPPGGGHKIVGPYTTAQQEGNANASSTGSAGSRNRRTTSSASPANGSSTKATSTSKQTTTTTAAAPAPPASYLPRRGDHMPPREASVAHVQPKGALEDAARQRSGYSGFHKVATSQTTNNYHHPLPSKFPNYTPSGSSAAGPPSTIYAKKAAEAASYATKPSSAPSSPPAVKSRQPMAYQPPALSAADMTHLPADTAYERKKQRAKDARVKLNESIERLHVSMSVAGIESKRRTEQLRDIIKKAGRSTETTTDHQAFQLMESCVKTAESAKKWDRPNFVGSAATMIQCLNSQCEILMKELLEYQHGGRKKSSSSGGPTSTTTTNVEPIQKIAMNEKGKNAASPAEGQPQPDQQELTNGKRSPQEALTAGTSTEGHPEKRRRLSGVYHKNDEKKESSSATEGVDANPVSSEATAITISVRTPQGNLPVQLEKPTMDLIASFLDPGSLMQCMNVCKRWRVKNGSFTNSETWVNLCVKRFGFFKVRQWQEKHCEDGGEEGGSTHENGVSGLTLYRRMDDDNVMPQLQLDSGGRQTLLGASRLASGGISAWMFLVERSNGETMRSVKRNPDEKAMPRGAGIYSSLPVVELRIVIQNTGGMTSTPFGKRGSEIVIKDQRLTVDTSTRRRGGEMSEIYWDTDGRFSKKILTLDGSLRSKPADSGELARLELFETIVLVVYIHARGCSTTTKFVQRSNFMKVLASVNGTTQPIVIPFVNQLM